MRRRWSGSQRTGHRPVDFIIRQSYFAFRWHVGKVRLGVGERFSYQMTHSPSKQQSVFGLLAGACQESCVVVALTRFISTCHATCSQHLDSPYRELKSEPPNTYFIDLRQMEATLYQQIIEIIKRHKMQFQNMQGRRCLRQKNAGRKMTCKS